MTRREGPLGCAGLALFCGAGLLYSAIYFRSDRNWTLFQVPFPGPGLVSADLFHVSTSGRFEPQVVVPNAVDPSEKALPPKAPAVGLVKVQVERKGGTTVERDIRTFHAGGRFFGGAIYFGDASFDLSPGDYKVRVTTVTDVPIFRSNGAVLSLSRVAESSGWVVGAMLFRAVGFTLLGIALTIIIALAVWTDGP